MNFPNKIKIGGLVYTVEVTENMCSDHAAEIDYNRQILKVRPDYHPQKTWQSLWHEIIHGILSNLGYFDHNEKQVDEMACSLWSLFVDNPDLPKFWKDAI